MKFKELPEGHYLILRTLEDTVYVEKREIKPDEHAIYEMDPYLIKVVANGRSYRHFGRELDNLEAVFKSRDEVRKEQRTERKSYGMKLGHVTKLLMQHKPLTGKALETALELVGDNSEPVTDSSSIYHLLSNKFKTGQPLNDYELHIVVDVLVPQSKLSI